MPLSTKAITKAVFPVAGLGTRFLPATKASPKEMLNVVDKPLIQYAVEEAIAAGIVDFAHIDSKVNMADIFTKPLPTSLFTELVDKYLFRRPRTLTLEEFKQKQSNSLIEGE